MKKIIVSTFVAMLLVSALASTASAKDCRRWGAACGVLGEGW